MKITTVKYTARYDEFGSIRDVWVSAEGALDDVEVAENQLDKIKEIVDKWYQSRHPQPGNQAPSVDYASQGIGPRVIEVERTSEDMRVAELIRDIYRCTELDGDNGLFTYHKLASTCQEAQAAYDVMKNKLVAKETKEILDATEKETMRKRTNNFDK